MTQIEMFVLDGRNTFDSELTVRNYDIRSAKSTEDVRSVEYYPEKHTGDTFNHRAIFVRQDDSTYLDDMLFCAAVPAAVHWEGETRSNSMMISDERTRENGNLIGDYSEYLRKIEARPDIDFIGNVTEERKSALAGYFSDVESSNNITTASNIYDGACDIAKYYWMNERRLGTDTAVLSHVPNSDGGVEVQRDTSGANFGQFEVNTDLNSDEVSWLKFSIDWSDPEADTDYRIEIRDPLALHERSYSNAGNVGQVNPTNNRLYSNAGHCEVGVSPYYSYLPYSIDNDPQGYEQVAYRGELVQSDRSVYPIEGAADHKTFQFGPVKAGQWIGVVTNWTHYVVNESKYRDFDTFVYRPNQGPGDDHLLEIAYNPGLPGYHLGTTPETGYCYADVDGYYSVTVHPYNTSIGGSFTTGVYWGGLDEESMWTAKQINHGTDPVQYHLEEYAMTDDHVIESVTNGAVVASLNNIPLFYTAGGQPEPNVAATLQDMGITKLIVIDPGNKISTLEWEGKGFSLDHVKGDKEVFNYIYDLSVTKKIHKGTVINAQGGPWFTGAALTGAYHGVPIPALDDPEMVHIQNQATTTWWQMIQLTDVYDFYPYNRYQAPNQANMEDLADDFFSWIEGFHPDYNPDCGDKNGDGIPDNGNYWDYSEDVEIFVISPLNALKPALDRAINGKASVGRIPIADPSALWAVVNREMLYWKVGYSRADNPEDPDDSPPVGDHWKRAGWTFNSYAHDDGIMDNDSGDQDDDDFCGMDDGGANHLTYRGRETWPTLAQNYGKINDYNTYYTNIRDMLEKGTCYWSNNGHGHHYNMMETGIGATATSMDSSNPKFAGPPQSNSFVDPPLEMTTGWDWYYGIDNIHSAFSTFQSCQVGGSSLPEYFLRLGGIAVVGGTVTRSLIEATIQHDRTARGLFSGMSFGDSHRWGADETGCIYSLKDPGTKNKNYGEAGFADDMWVRYGDTGQTILYGDPSLVMIAPTLWTDVRWSSGESAEHLTITITIRDQYGLKVTPDSLDISMDGVQTGFSEEETGIYSIDWLPTDYGSHSLKLTISKEGYTSRQGSPVISQNYDLFVPRVRIDPFSILYTPGLAQTLDLNVKINYTHPEDRPLTGRDCHYVKAGIFNENNTNTELKSELIYDDDRWGVKGWNVSSLATGDYYIMIRVSPRDSSYLEKKTDIFSVIHGMHFNSPEMDFNHSSKQLNLWNLTATSTWSIHGRLSPTEISLIRYEVISDDPTVPENVKIEGEPDYDYRSESFVILNASMAPLLPGSYHLEIFISTSYSEAEPLKTESFSINSSFYIFGPDIEYVGRMTQMVYLSNVLLSSSTDPLDSGYVGNLTEYAYKLFSDDEAFQGISGNLTLHDGLWNASINVSGLHEGSYYVEVSFVDAKLGSAAARSGRFNVSHYIQSTVPEVNYDRTAGNVKIFVSSVRSSYRSFPVIDETTSDLNDFKVFNQDGTETGIFGKLSCVKGKWSAEFSASDLTFGAYYISCYFGYAGHVTEVNSSLFDLEFPLHVNEPLVIYNQLEDEIRVFGIRPYSDTATIGYLDPYGATEMSVRILDLKGEVVMEGILDYENGEFYIIFGRISKRVLVSGSYWAEVTFATVNIDPVSNLSKPFSILYDEDEGDKEEIPQEEGSRVLGLIGAVFILLILLAAIIHFFIRRDGRGTTSGVRDGAADPRTDSDMVEDIGKEPHLETFVPRRAATDHEGKSSGMTGTRIRKRGKKVDPAFNELITPVGTVRKKEIHRINSLFSNRPAKEIVLEETGKDGDGVEKFGDDHSEDDDISR